MRLREIQVRVLQPDCERPDPAARAVWEAICGNAAEAKKNAMAALELSNGRDVEYAAGLALALSGDSPRSQPLADDLERRVPEDTFATLLTYRFFARYRHWSAGINRLM
jgi:hypothetical protein